MTSGMRTVVYPVKDLARAKKLYSELLGVAPAMDEAYYVGFRVGGQDIGLDPHRTHSVRLIARRRSWGAPGSPTRLSSMASAPATWTGSSVGTVPMGSVPAVAAGRISASRSRRVCTDVRSATGSTFFRV